MSALEIHSTEVREALGLPPDGGHNRYTSVSTDTRTLEPGALFVALKGERYDAVDLLPEAEAKGALGAVVPASRALPVTGLELFGVPDATRALGDLAAWHRLRHDVRVVGITGSSGKTTVKEMVAGVLGRGYRVYKTAGNLNSQVGLPLAIFDAPPEADCWVLELGASEPGEIARLAEIAAPTDAVVTTVGPAHLEFFGTVERVLKEKLSLVEAASPEGSVVVGERPDFLATGALRLRPDTVVAGIGKAATWRPDEYTVGADEVAFLRDGVEYRVPAGGRHHLADALIAAALADQLGIPPADVAAGLLTYRPLGMRSALEQHGRLTVIADCYNANPESFAAAIEYCADAFPDRRRVAVVGTMLELGKAAEKAHRDVARQLVKAHFDLVAATGDFVAAFQGLRIGRNGTGVVAAESLEQLWSELVPKLSGDEVVLVKASRGVQLDGIVDRLRRFGSTAAGEAEGAGGASVAGEAGTAVASGRRRGGLMLFHLLFPLADRHIIFNVFQYISFRAAGAMVTSLLLAFVVGPPVIRWLKNRGWGQVVRLDGPSSHFKKAGTPTMGGLIIVVSVLVSTFLWARLDNPYVLIVAASTAWFGAIGFMDDYLKVVRHEPRGLVVKYKLFWQLAAGLTLGVFLLLFPLSSRPPTHTMLPFFKDLYVVFWPPAYPLFVALVVTGSSNGVNLADGLDGLAAGLSGIAALTFGLFAYVIGRVDTSAYLGTFYLPGAGELGVFCAAITGAAIGFLWFNAPPADVFMGDTGSLALGGALGVTAVLLKSEFLLLLVGGVFVAEAVSVLMQTGWFKFTRWRTGTGRRLFKMAPLHHHFEKSGWPEARVVVRFYILAILCALVSLATLKVR